MDGSHSVSGGQIHSAKAHPSARHRRNHKKHDALMHEDHITKGSLSEENSSEDDDHHAEEGTEHTEDITRSKLLIVSSESISSAGIKTDFSGDGVNESSIPLAVESDIPLAMESSKMDVDEFGIHAKKEVGLEKETTLPEKETSINATNDTNGQVGRLDETFASSFAIIETTMPDLNTSHIVAKENLDLDYEPGAQEVLVGGDAIHEETLTDGENVRSEFEDLSHEGASLKEGSGREGLSTARSEETTSFKRDDTSTGSFTMEQGLSLPENAITKDLSQSDTIKQPLSNTLMVEDVKASDHQSQEKSIRMSTNTAENESVPVSFMSCVEESQLRSVVEQRILSFKASSMRCDSLDTDAYEDAVDTLETCSIGGSIDDFDLYQSLSDSSMAQEGVVKESSKDGQAENLIGFEAASLPAAMQSEAKEDSKDSPQQKALKLQAESLEERSEQKSSIDASVKQDDGQGIALQALLAKDKLDNPIRSSIASSSVDSDQSGLKPKGKPFWAHCLCCSTVQ